MPVQSFFGFDRRKGSKKSRRGKRRGSRNRQGLSFQSLESRRMLAGIFFSSGEVTIAGGAGGDIGSFIQVDASTYQASLSGFADQSFSAATVNKVIFIGFDGNDVFTNSTGVESLMLGNDGDDVLYGGTGVDVANGGSGNDQIFGGTGEDRLVGNTGDDLLVGGDGNDRLFGGDGFDEMNGDSGDDIMFGGLQADTMNGGDGADQIFSGGGDDIVSLGDGGTPGATDLTFADLVLGGDGNDTFTGGDGLNVFWGGDGDDVFIGGNGENRMHGQNGNDDLTSGSSNDYLAGQVGNDTIRGGGGNDYILPGFGDDVIDGGAGYDFVAFTFDFNRYQVTTNGTQLTVYDTIQVDGTDTVSAIQGFRFTDGDRAAQAGITERVTIQPIIVSNTNGSNTAEFFGDANQEADIKLRIDQIYSQAGVDIAWLDPTYYNNTFANVGNGGARPQSDLGTVNSQGDAAGVGNSDPLVIDMYFVEVSAGFSETSEYNANGLAWVDANGITIHIGDELVGFDNGRAVAARVAAHEIAHNLGLDHVGPSTNLMSSGTELTASQINTILDSAFSIPV